MARKTNKTDHVLNLLSSGKKTGGNKEENDAPPVDLRRNLPDISDLPDSRNSDEEDSLPEPKMSERPVQNEEHELPEPKMPEQTTEEELSEPRKSEPREDTELPEPKTTVEVAPKMPAVSVVHTAGSENPIADAVKDSLEAEFNEFLREKEEAIQREVAKQEEAIERVIKREDAAEQEVNASTEETKPKEPTEINVFELLKESDGEDAADENEPAAVSTNQTDEKDEEETPPPQKVAKPEEEMVQPQKEAEPEKESILPQKEEEMQPKQEEKDYIMVNVMEHLVREQVPAYIRQFGHCDCDRCIEDTIALTLTHLPAKYVVVSKDAVSPLLNFYEKKYAGQLIVEITKATMIVKESPHH